MSTPAIRVIETYELLQVASAPAGYRSVWIERSPDAPGRYRLEVEPLAMVGLAEVAEHRRPSDGKPRRYRKTVALGLVDGGFIVSDGAANFAGIVHEGDDLREAAAGLDIPDEVFDALDWPEEDEQAVEQAAGPSEAKSGAAA